MMIRWAVAAVILLMSVPASQAQVYRDLPGVVTNEEHEAEPQVACVPRYVPPPENSTSRHYGRTVYDCTRNGVTTTGSRMPPSRERQLRGLGW
jgi:hypothetical protein